MDYLKFQIELPNEQLDLMLGHLSVLPFEAFEEKDQLIEAYLPKDEDLELVKDQLRQIKDYLEFKYQVVEVPNKNWNAVWESNFQPIQVEDFCYIYASFHQPNPAIPYNLLIEPKMAFGTGHHETTYMVIKLMESIDFKGKSVFDFGCGTGILAILAEKLGANLIDAVDYDDWAAKNTEENLALNHCKNVWVQMGSIDLVEDKKYQVILANINRKVILDTLNTLKSLLLPNGHLLVSGILQTDAPLILSKAQAVGLFPQDSLQRGEWTAFEFVHMQP